MLSNSHIFPAYQAGNSRAAASLSPEQTRAILDAFQKNDVHNCGHLDKHQLKCAYATLMGTKPNRYDLARIMSHADDEGCVGWQSFLALMQELLASIDPDEHIRRVFKSCDLRGCGFISRGDAHTLFRASAPTVAPRVVDEVFDELDMDNDGRVSCRDFITMMRMRPGVPGA